MDLISTEMGGSLAEQANKMNNQDAFEDSDGPIIYMADNRMPAVVEFKSITIYIIYFSLLLLLMLILPGVRRTKTKSLFCLITLLTVGASILLAMDGSHWLTGRLQIRRTKYSALQPDETISGQLEINIGLNSVNVSLSGLLDDDTDNYGANNRSGEHTLEKNVDVDEHEYIMYNERFSWSSPERMLQEHRDALSRGLPYPILTITEYFSHDADGFNWSRRLREAGHFSSMCLCAALVGWLLTAVSMCVLPSLQAVLMLLTGALMTASVGVYAMLIPSMDSLAIRMLGGQLVEFEWGLNYATTHAIGLLTILAGLILFVWQEHADPSKQFTIMESEQNAIDRKVLSLKSCSKSQQAAAAASTIDSKPNNRLMNLLIGVGGGLSSATEKQQTNNGFQSAAGQSVIIPIGDIEENFKSSN